MIYPCDIVLKFAFWLSHPTERSAITCWDQWCSMCLFTHFRGIIIKSDVHTSFRNYNNHYIRYAEIKTGLVWCSTLINNTLFIFPQLRLEQWFTTRGILRNITLTLISTSSTGMPRDNTGDLRELSVTGTVYYCFVTKIYQSCQRHSWLLHASKSSVGPSYSSQWTLYCTDSKNRPLARFSES